MTPEQAIAHAKAYKKRLKGLRYVLFANPTPENLKNYLVYEKKMWNNVDRLESAFRLTRYQYPELFDTLKEPTNVQAVKLQRSLDSLEGKKKIVAFAKDFDLVLFIKDSCPYCIEFAPIVKRFSETYGFKIESVTSEEPSNDHSMINNVPGLAEKLNIKNAPTLVAVSKDGSQAFELVRGLVSISELEEFTSVAFDYINQNPFKTR